MLLFRFWRCGFSSIWGDSTALDEALPKWIISKATGICNSSEQMSLTLAIPGRLFGATLCSLLEIFGLWFSLVTTVQSPPTTSLLPKRDRHEREIQSLGSLWGPQCPTPVKRSYSTRKDEEGWGTDLSLYIKRSICIHVYAHMYINVCVCPYLFFKQSLCLSLFEFSSQSLRGRPLKEKFLRQFQKHSGILFSFLSLSVMFLSSDYTKEPYSNSELLEFPIFIYKTFLKPYNSFLFCRGKILKPKCQTYLVLNSTLVPVWTWYMTVSINIGVQNAVQMCLAI